MSWLRRLLASEEEPSPRGPTDDFWYSEPGGAAAGMKVTPETALTIGAVYRAVAVLANAVAMLPFITYERLEPEGKQRATKHALYRLLHRKPNVWQSSFEWRQMQMGHLLLRGNAFNLIDSDARGNVLQLIPLHPGRMRVEQLSNRRLRYLYRDERNYEQRLDQDSVLHFRALSSDGICGLAPVTLMRRTLGVGIALDEFGARQFEKRPMPAGMLETPKILGDGEGKRIGKSFADVSSGPSGWYGVPVLENGLQWKAVGMTNADAEFLASRKFSRSEIATWFGVPPHMIGDLDRATFSNIEEQSLALVIHSIMPWLVNIEQRVELDLFLEDVKYFAEFLVDGLLRGDAESRAAADAIYLDRQVVTPNEIRARDNKNPVAWGDKPITPQGQAAQSRPPSERRRPPPERAPDEDEGE